MSVVPPAVKAMTILTARQRDGSAACNITGIALCSEFELLHKRELVARRPLAVTSRGAPDKPQRERSAAVIWQEIERSGKSFDIVLWNAFPWHPYRAEGLAQPCGPS